MTGELTSTVNDKCPKDCRYRALLMGDSYNYPVYYCNYGSIAYDEGKSSVPIRGGSVDDCTVYEKRKKKRERVNIVINHKKSLEYRKGKQIHDEENI